VPGRGRGKQLLGGGGPASWGAAGAGVGARRECPGNLLLAAPSQVQSTSSVSLSLPSASRGNPAKPKTPRTGAEKRAQLRRGARRGARGRQAGGALGLKGAFVSLTARGHLEHSSRGSGGLGQGHWLVPGPAESALRGHRRLGRGLWARRKALVELG
jgi:hypothetical protein